KSEPTTPLYRETMTNRRDFLITLASVAYFQTTPSGIRHEVFVRKKRVKVIDSHGHFVAKEELDVVKDTPVARNVSNNLSGGLALGPDRLRVLDDQGIDIQVLSHQGGWWYGLDRDISRRLIKV